MARARASRSFCLASMLGSSSTSTAALAFWTDFCALATLFLALVTAFLFGGDPRSLRWGNVLGLNGFILPVFLTVAHRMVPFFAGNVVTEYQRWRPDWRSLQAPAPAALQPGQSPLFDDLLTHAPTWDDVIWLREQTRLPVLLKGITHPADAQQALACGVAGLIVSNHGGRTLDTLPATANLLPAIAQAVGGALPLLVDGGIRRGTDVLKAIALGATAVLVGRPVIHGLANAGATGVAHVIRLLRDELEIAMALSGCRTLDEASAALWSRQSG